MAIYKAITKDGVVLNVVALPDNWQPGGDKAWPVPAGCEAIDVVGQDGVAASPGDTLQNGVFVKPAPPEPEKTPVERDIAALKAGFQALVDEKVIPKDKLPPDLKDDITVAAAEIVL